MELEFYPDPAAFLAVAADHLAADPVLGTVMASVTERAAREIVQGVDSGVDFPRWWLAVRDESGQVTGLAMRSAPFAPHPLYLMAMPDAAAAELGRALRARGEAVGGINGARPAVDACAAAYVRGTGRRVEVAQHTRLFELGTLHPPPLPPGRLRVAEPDDVAVALAWFEAFHDDADAQAGRAPGSSHPGESAEDEASMLRRIEQGRVWFWVDEAGERVHLTGANPPSFGVARIGPVYTPPQHRRRGYAGAAVAAVSQALLDEGARVCLFTDQANPTSNHIYTELGFRPVVDLANLAIS